MTIRQAAPVLPDAISVPLIARVVTIRGHNDRPTIRVKGLATMGNHCHSYGWQPAFPVDANYRVFFRDKVSLCPLGRQLLDPGAKRPVCAATDVPRSLHGFRRFKTDDSSREGGCAVIGPLSG